jgi:hypothetical protein
MARSGEDLRHCGILHGRGSRPKRLARSVALCISRQFPDRERKQHPDDGELQQQPPAAAIHVIQATDLDRKRRNERHELNQTLKHLGPGSAGFGK